MGKVKLPLDEQKALRKKTRAELDRIEKILEKDETVQLLNEFKNKFNLCETAYKVVFKEYKKTNPNKSKENGKGDLDIAMTQVPFVLKFAGYDVEKNLLKEIFGSSGSKRMTAKSLRNAVTHGIDEKAVKQIEDRKDELFGYMDEFLNLIKSSD